MHIPQSVTPATWPLLWSATFGARQQGCRLVYLHLCVSCFCRPVDTRVWLPLARGLRVRRGISLQKEQKDVDVALNPRGLTNDQDPFRRMNDAAAAAPLPARR